MKNIFLKFLAAIVGLLLLASTPVLIFIVLVALAACYWGLVLMTHHLIHNNWIAVPIDLFVLGVIYSLIRTSREHFSSTEDEED